MLYLWYYIVICKIFLLYFIFNNNKKISIAKVQSILMSLSGVTDCSNVLINGKNTNIILKEEETSVLNSVSLGVM